MSTPTAPEQPLGWCRADCPKCHGEGVVYSGWSRTEGEDGETVCRTCGGKGWVVEPITDPEQLDEEEPPA